MVTVKRWHQAQQYERSFWEDLAGKIESGALTQLDWYAWKAKELERRLSNFLDADAQGTARVLEIGSGPLGIVNFLDWGECFAIDPLERFYRESKTLTQLRTSRVTYLAGTGEDLPFEDRFFSLVIIDNVIDHTYAPEKILQQIRRVLAPDAILYLAVNVHTRWGALLHSLVAMLSIDTGHPYTFTSAAARHLLLNSRFTICEEETEDYHRSKQQNCRSTSWRDKVKGYTGLSEFQFHAIARAGREAEHAHDRVRTS